MSRLWNSLLAKLLPPPTGSVGLVVGRNNLLAVLMERDGNEYSVARIAEEILPFELFAAAAPSAENCESISKAMERLSAAVPQTYCLLQIALPDPAAVFQIMEFDSLPQTEGEREAIALFKFGKEFPGQPEMRCATQVISSKNEKGLMLSAFIQKAWLDCINDACRRARWVPNVIDARICYIFNRFYEVLQSAPGDGVLISIESDAWSILFWDAQQRPRLVRSRWRESSALDNQDHESIALDIERLIMSYVLRVPGRKIGRIFFSASKEDFEMLVAQLDGGRLHIPCVYLDSMEGISVVSSLTSQVRFPSAMALAAQRI